MLGVVVAVGLLTVSQTVWAGSAQRSWQKMSPTTSPAGRCFHAMVYESMRGRTVLFGGYDGGWLGDTWE